jgi:hypothetical protein
MAIEISSQGIDVAVALAKLPANERAAFADAIKARAEAWDHCEHYERPRVWPMVLQVVRDPKL